MKKGMGFHFVFTFWLSYFVIFGFIFILLIPNNIGGLITSYQAIPDTILMWWQVIIKDVVMGILCVLAIPIFYQLVNRVNLNLKKMKFFLWTYVIGRILLNIVDRVCNPSHPFSPLSLISHGVELILVYFIIKAILMYYQNRAHLFGTESKEVRHAKIKAYINRLTFGIISFER